MSREIPLTQGYVAIVDDADYEGLMQWKWHAHKATRSLVAERTEDGKKIMMHRQITKAPPGMPVDHANHDTLDNQRHNLRVCSHRENQRNRCKQGNCSSRFKGVYWNKQRQKWHARIKTEERRINAGFFDDECEAARAYNAEAVNHFKEFAVLNDV